MVVASFCILTFCLLYDNYITTGTVINMTAFVKFFRGSDTVFLNWCILVLIHFSIIPLVKIALKTKIFVWLPLYISHILCIVYFSLQVSYTANLGFASVFIIMCEGTRMFMKSHSYLRSKLLYLKNNSFKDYEVQGRKVNGEDKNDPKMKITFGDFPLEVKRLSYFFFAPTLIYRDHYTLTPLRSVTKIFIHFINFMACIYYCNYLYISSLYVVHHLL